MKCGLYTLKKSVADNFSFNLQGVFPCTFTLKGIPASNQCIVVFTWVWVTVTFTKTANAESL